MLSMIYFKGRDSTVCMFWGKMQLVLLLLYAAETPQAFISVNVEEFKTALLSRPLSFVIDL